MSLVRIELFSLSALNRQVIPAQSESGMIESVSKFLLNETISNGA